MFWFTLQPQRVKVSSTGSDTEGETTTILMVVADPGNAGWQRLDNELRAVDQAVHGSPMVVEPVAVTSLPGLEAALPSQERSIIHFTGQAGEGAGVPLTAEDSGTAPVSAEELGRFFQANALHVGCVVLSPCCTPQQGLAIAEHVPCVAGTPPAMPGDAALAFSRAFTRRWLPAGLSGRHSRLLSALQARSPGVMIRRRRSSTSSRARSVHALLPDEAQGGRRAWIGRPASGSRRHLPPFPGLRTQVSGRVS